MPVKSDKWIKKMCDEKKMIEPFVDHQVRDGVVSYGLSSYGYDMRLADEFKIFSQKGRDEVDPKGLDESSFADFKGEICVIPANSFVLARSLEYFRIPRNVLAICLGKSTYARCGLITNITPLEPCWQGHVTIAISNTSPRPAKVYANEGIAQVIFIESDEECLLSYEDKRGAYQAQKKITLPKIARK